jgi:hypothetical protein
MSVHYNKEINPELLGHCPEICPFHKSASNQQEEEKHESSSLVEMIIDVSFVMTLAEN